MSLQDKQKKLKSVWLMGPLFCVYLLILPFLSLYPALTSEGLWGFTFHSISSIQKLSLKIFMVIPAIFMIEVIRNRFAVEKRSLDRIELYEIVYTISWIFLFCSLSYFFSILGHGIMSDFFFSLSFGLVCLVLFRKNVSLLGFRKPTSVPWMIVVIILFLGLSFVTNLVDISIAEWLSIDLYSERLGSIKGDLVGYVVQGEWISVIVWIFMTSIAAPLCEEIFFRGLIQSYFVHRMGPYLGITMGAILFAIAHGDPAYFGSLFVHGILSGILFVFFNSIWPSITLHFLINAFAAIAALKSVGWGLGQGLLILCIPILLTLLLVRFWRKWFHIFNFSPIVILLCFLWSGLLIDSDMAIIMQLGITSAGILAFVIATTSLLCKEVIRNRVIFMFHFVLIIGAIGYLFKINQIIYLCDRFFCFLG